MAASLQAAATFMQPTKVGSTSRNLKSTQCISKAFGLEPAAPKLTCSLQSDLKDLAHKCLDATKLAGFALASSALLVSVCLLAPPFSLTTFNYCTFIRTNRTKVGFHEMLCMR